MSDIENLSEVVRFSIQASGLVEFQGFTVFRSEIQAKMQLGQYDACIALAQSAVLINDRLRLMAAIGRKRREANGFIEADLMAAIQGLFDQAEWSEMGNEGLSDLGEDLIYVRADLATQVFERLTTEAMVQRGDYALAAASVAMEGSENPSMGSEAETLRAAIRDRRVSKLATAAAAFVKNVNGSRVIEEVSALENVKDQLYMLRQWAVHSNVRDGARAVIVHTLELGIRTTEYTVTATHLREVAEALRRVPAADLADLISQFDSQLPTVEKLGPTNEVCKLQILLASLEYGNDLSAAQERIAGLFRFVSEIQDVPVRAACLAELKSALSGMDVPENLAKEEGLNKSIDDDLNRLLKEILESTAEHDLAVKDIVQALSGTHTSTAISIALSLNTVTRRDACLSWLLKCILSAPDECFRTEYLSEVLDNFYDESEAEEALSDICQRFARIDADPKVQGSIPLLHALTGRTESMRDTRLQLECLSSLERAFNKCDKEKHVTLIAKLCSAMETAWNSLDVRPEKVDAAFSLGRDLFGLDPRRAEQWVLRADACRSLNNLSNGNISERNSLHLAIRAFGALLQHKVDSAEEDLKELEVRIDTLSSRAAKTFLWNEVALRLFKHDRTVQGKDVVNRKLKRLLGENETGSVALLVAQAFTAPALFCANSTAALEIIAQLPPLFRNDAVWLTVMYICRRAPEWEPYEQGYRATYKLTDDDIAHICALAELSERDTTLYAIVRLVCGSVVSPEGKRLFCQSQKSAIGRRLGLLVDKKLPNKTYIKHAGYKIICRAQILRLSSFNRASWEAIVADAHCVDNIADRAYILREVAELIIKDDRTWASDLLQQAAALTDRIPVVIDRVERYSHIAEALYDLDKAAAAEYYRKALRISASSDGAELENARHNVIDSAHRISPDLAEKIASALDEDVARRVKRGVSARMEVLALQRRLSDPRLPVEMEGGAWRKTLPGACWGLLGGLNSGRVVPRKISQTYGYAEYASLVPFSEAYPIFSFVIENAGSRAQDKGQASRFLRSMFVAVLTAADLFSYLGERRANRPSQVVVQGDSDGDSFVMIAAGEREKGLEALLEWLKRITADKLIVHDPFLLPDDVAMIMQMILQLGSDLETIVITSQKALQRASGAGSLKDIFTQAWTRKSAQDPPTTRIIVVGMGQHGSAPVHDRWWIAGDEGLETGTSFSALGVDRVSKISFMTPAEARGASKKLEGFAAMSIRQQSNERIVYESVDL